MRINDAVAGLFLVIFALAEITYSLGFPSLYGQSYGPNLFPILIGCGLIVCGLALVVRGWQEKKAATDTVWLQWGDWVSDSRRRTNMILMPALLIAYILFSDIIGFLPVSIAILFTLLYRMGSSLVVSLLIAVVTTVLLQLLFAHVLLVPLPAGLLVGWLG